MARNDSPERNVEVNEPNRDKGKVPPPVFSGPPEQETEERLNRNPDDEDAKVDLGSDESMDASDPPSSSQPGSDQEPSPSSGFPEKKDR